MIDYINKPRYWEDLEAFLAEAQTGKDKNSSFLYSRVEKINDTLYVGERKTIDLYTTIPL